MAERERTYSHLQKWPAGVAVEEAGDETLLVSVEKSKSMQQPKEMSFERMQEKWNINTKIKYHEPFNLLQTRMWIPDTQTVLYKVF